MSADSKASDRFVIIMAGGKGERFWPLSRERSPKQLLAILSERSFLQQAVDRVLPIVPAENILVITNTTQAPAVREQLPMLPEANVVAEPVGRDTCAAVTLGAALVNARNSEGVMAVLPADHIIPEEENFRRVLLDCFAVAQAERAIVTIGIQPDHPSTAYGYIAAGEKADRKEAANATRFYRALRFVEKPPLERAVEFLKAGNYRWNAGMFIWSCATILDGLAQHQPEMHQACERWSSAARHGPGELEKMLTREYPAIQKISIDYALMERAENVFVADGAFAWDDLGSWTALTRHLPADEAGNCARGEIICVESHGNIVFDARRAAQRTPVALLGAKDMILVLTDDATLMAHKHESQRIKEIVKRLAEDTRYKTLL